MDWQKEYWRMMGAAIAELEHGSDAHFDLDESFQFLLEEHPTCLRAHARRAFDEGYHAYVDGRAFRTTQGYRFLEVMA